MIAAILWYRMMTLSSHKRLLYQTTEQKRISETCMIPSTRMFNKRLKQFNDRLFKRIRTNNDNQCSYEYVDYNEEESIRPVCRLSRSSSMITCAPSSVIIAASDSATCTSIESMLDAKRFAGGQQHVTKCANCYNPYVESAACAPRTSDLSVCTAPSVIIPDSMSATMQMRGVSHYYHNLSELGMDMEFYHCQESIIY